MHVVKVDPGIAQLDHLEHAGIGNEEWLQHPQSHVHGSYKFRPCAGTVLVTGAPRTGTTFCERLLDAHPDASIVSQPFPFLYQAVKRDWLARWSTAERYPLGSLFGEDRYSLEQFSAHLGGLELSTGWVQSALRSMRGYGGCWTPEVHRVTDQFVGGSFVQVQRSANLVAARALGRAATTVTGSKEVIVEEFAPALLRSGSRVVMTLRDPRAVVASTYFGRGPEFTGDPRPLIFTVRNWRKSVAFAIAFGGDDGLLAVRYEELADASSGAVRRLYDHVGLEPLEAPGELRDQSGRDLAATSSFTPIPGEAFREPWQNVLDHATLRYVEALCLPEMLTLGYQPVSARLQVGDVASYSEPFDVSRSGLPADLSHDPVEVARELERVEVLATPEATSRALFVCPGVEATLRAALHRSPSLGGDLYDSF